MRLIRIPPHLVAQKWEEVAPFLEDALVYSGDDFSLEQVKVYLSIGQWILIGVWDEETLKGAMTVSFTNMPNDRVAFITAIGGKNITNGDTFQQFTAILRECGATKIQGSVRQSVARLWRRLGFQERSIIVEKKI